MPGQFTRDERSGLRPPDGGELRVVVQGAPVSLQANRDAKLALTRAVRHELAAAQYILTGEVSMDVEWMIHERVRYETDIAPDVDNVLKPIADALAGPAGVIIDDCQVQAVSCRWIDWAATSQMLTVSVRYRPDEWLPKPDLAFVHMGHSLYMPVCESSPSEGAALVLSTWQMMFASRAKLLEAGWDYSQAQGVMPVQRPFHKSRIAGKFPIYEMGEFHSRHRL
jgi:Holliday junction resolvase RusA-like endonuclease